MYHTYLLWHLWYLVQKCINSFLAYKLSHGWFCFFGGGGVMGPALPDAALVVCGLGVGAF